MDCVFCRIIKGEIPAVKIYENEKVVVFLDMHPNNPGHMLVVPKKHYINILDCPDDLLGEITLTTKKISLAAVKALNLTGFNIIQNNGEVAGQVVPHFHWHVIPRSPGDGLELWHGKAYNPGEGEIVAKKIKHFLQ